jgi:hypothetical protein
MNFGFSRALPAVPELLSASHGCRGSAALSQVHFAQMKISAGRSKLDKPLNQMKEELPRRFESVGAAYGTCTIQGRERVQSRVSAGLHFPFFVPCPGGPMG